MPELTAKKPALYCSKGQSSPAVFLTQKGGCWETEKAGLAHTMTFSPARIEGKKNGRGFLPGSSIPQKSRNSHLMGLDRKREGGSRRGEVGETEMGGRGRNTSTVPKILRCQPARLHDPAHGQPGICTKRVESTVTQESPVTQEALMRPCVSKTSHRSFYFLLGLWLSNLTKIAQSWSLNNHYGIMEV